LGAGRHTQQKDFPTLIKAFSKVRQNTKCRLCLLGKGELSDEYVALADRLGIEDSFELLGYVDNPYKYMRGADLFVLSSIWEGFGNVIVEAMACGTPIVSTDCPSGPAEILDEGEYGSLVPVGDSEKMAEAIISSLENPTSPDKVQRRAEEFSDEQILPQYEEFLFGGT
jgi:glycosyltransferase involved in cell wall biosynthesis